MDKMVLQGAFEGFERRLAAVAASQWGLATPCAEWDVRALVNHMTGELFWIPPLIEGRTIAEVGDRFDGDVLGDDPLATWRAAAAAALEATADPGVDERIVHLSFGDLPAGEYLGQVTSDAIIHGWDLARAIGAPDAIEPPLLDFALAFLEPQVEMWQAAGVFAPPVDPGPDAGAQARLLGLTGRGAA
jgi:uncharacterized protein (TIGR03086 family)